MKCWENIPGFLFSKRCTKQNSPNLERRKRKNFPRQLLKATPETQCRVTSSKAEDESPKSPWIPHLILAQLHQGLNKDTTLLTLSSFSSRKIHFLSIHDTTSLLAIKAETEINFNLNPGTAFSLFIWLKFHCGWDTVLCKKLITRSPPRAESQSQTWRKYFCLDAATECRCKEKGPRWNSNTFHC